MAAPARIVILFFDDALMSRGNDVFQHDGRLPLVTTCSEGTILMLESVKDQTMAAADAGDREVNITLSSTTGGAVVANAAPIFQPKRTLFFEDSFDRPNGAPGAPWEIMNPGAVIENGRLKVASMGPPRDALVTAFDGDMSLRDVILSVDVDPVENTNWTNASIMMRVEDFNWGSAGVTGDGYRFDFLNEVGGRGSGLVDAMSFVKVVDGKLSYFDKVLFPSKASPFSVEVSAIQNEFRVFIDGALVFDFFDASAKSFGGFGLHTVWEATAYFDNLALYEVTGSAGSFAVEENALVGAVAGTVSATDPDGDTLVYAITGGNTDVDGDGTPAFSIDGSTGMITVLDSDDLDRAVQESIDLEVQVSDPGGLSDTTTVRVAINSTDTDFAKHDELTVSLDMIASYGKGWFRLGALNNGTDVLENDLGAEEIIHVNGSSLAPGVWFDGDGGGQFRVYPGGVVDFRNQGTPAVDGDTTGFTYTGSDGTTQDNARVSVTIDAGADIAKDDSFEVTNTSLVAAGRSWFRLGGLNDDTDLLENDLNVDEFVFVDGLPLEEGAWFDGDGGGQFRVFSGGVIDFRNQRDTVGIGDTTGFTYAVLDDGVLDTATVSMTVASSGGGAGVLIKGADRHYNSAHSVASAGDVDGDGLDDVIIGAFPAGQYRAGESYILYGAALATQETLYGILDLATLGAAEGVLIKGVDGNDFSGWSVSSAGDVDGDGLDDVIIGAIWADPDRADNAGESYLVYGAVLAAEKASDGVLDLATLGAAEKIVIRGVDMNDKSGVSVASAGDVDGDGLDDVIIGAASADPDGVRDAGESYLVYGAALATEKASDGVLDLATLGAAEGVVIKGVDRQDYNGFSVSSAGDVDGDGLDDIIIGARFADPDGADNAGESYVITGAMLAQEQFDDGIIDLGDWFF